MLLIRALIIFSTLIEFLKNLTWLTGRVRGNRRCDSKLAIISRGNTALGRELAHQLTSRGAKVILGCRDLTHGENVYKDILARNPKADISVMKLDLSSLRSVRKFAKNFGQQKSGKLDMTSLTGVKELAKRVAHKKPKLDLLINNTGAYPYLEEQTEDGFEKNFGKDHLGHFLLTMALMPYLQNSANSRVVTLSSNAHKWGDIDFDNIHHRFGAYNPMKAFAQSKLANVLFTRELASRLGPNSNVKTYSLHPGYIQNDLGDYVSNPWIKPVVDKLWNVNIEKAAENTLHCALDDSIKNESGSYYDGSTRVDSLSPQAKQKGERLWDLSSDLVGLEDDLRL